MQLQFTLTAVRDRERRGRVRAHVQSGRDGWACLLIMGERFFLARSARGKTWGALLDAARRCPLYRRGHRRATVAHPSPLHTAAGTAAGIASVSLLAARAQRVPGAVPKISGTSGSSIQSTIANKAEQHDGRWPTLADAGRRWQRWPTLADAGEGQQRLGEQDRCDDDGDAPRGGRGGHRSARSALLGAFDAARRVRRCSAHPALLGAFGAARRVRRCSARSALLGAFDAVRHVRRCSACSACPALLGAASSLASRLCPGC